MAPSSITDLSADIVPHQEWAFRQWFCTTGMRYYHRPRSSFAITAGKNFYERVDPQLREACRLLHAHGLRTTPSCQGHFHDKEYFAARWAELTREAGQIRGPGLRVTDAETDCRYLFRATDYRVPWRNFAAFYQDSRRHQPVGYLGIIVPFAEQTLNRRLQSILAGLSVPWLAIRHAPEPRLGGDLHHLTLNPQNPEEGARRWQRVTDHLRASLPPRG